MHETTLRRLFVFTAMVAECLPASASQVNKMVQQSSASQAKLFSFGLVADIQYAPIPDGFSYGGAPRFYRHSLDVARRAAQHFQDEKVDLAVNLGDIVDGKCQDIARCGGNPYPEGVDPGDACVDLVLGALSTYQQGKVLHTYGNHCLYNLNRAELQQKLGIEFVREECGDLVGYSSHVVNDVRFVILDSYDIALMQRCKDTSQKYQQAAAILAEHNPNYPGNENSPEGLEGDQMRYVAFNGGVGEVQLSWLRETLGEARQNQEKVIVISHQPILPGSSGGVCLIWNYQDVLDVLREYNDVVVVSLSGHAHKGGYGRDDESGIHFRVVEAALESFPDMSYAIVDVFEDYLSCRGFGKCDSAVYDFQHLDGDIPEGGYKTVDDLKQQF